MKEIVTPIIKSKKIHKVRQQIIAAAIDLFYENGFSKASLRDIARKVGITQAAIYYHFRNKEEILYTIIEKFSNDLLFDLKASFSGSEDPLQKLRNAIFQHIKNITSIQTSKKSVKIIIEDKRFLSSELNKLAKEKEKIIYNLYKNHLTELYRNRTINESELTVATFGILGMMNWLYHWYKPEGKLSPEQLVNEITKNLFFGLLGKEE